MMSPTPRPSPLLTVGLQTRPDVVDDAEKTYSVDAEPIILSGIRFLLITGYRCVSILRVGLTFQGPFP